MAANLVLLAAVFNTQLLGLRENFLSKQELSDGRLSSKSPSIDIPMGLATRRLSMTPLFRRLIKAPSLITKISEETVMLELSSVQHGTDNVFNSRNNNMITAYDHVALPMEKTEEMVEFYTNLGCRVVEQSSGRIVAVIFGDNKINFHTPDLWQSPQFTLRGPTALPGCGDLCFVWQGSQQSLADTLSAAGADIEEGPVERTGGMNGGSTRGISVYTRDPDSNLLEFIIYG